MAKIKTAKKLIQNRKPTSAGQRAAEYEDRRHLNKVVAPKSLLSYDKNSAGRGNGKISVRHRGGGVKRMLREIDFKREKFLDQKAIVIDLQYDPNRSAYLALIKYQNGKYSFILAPDGLKVKDEVICSEKAKNSLGNRMKLKNMPQGVQVYNVEVKPGKGGQLVRSAGSAAILESKDGDYVQLRLPSRERRLILGECFATIGQVSNAAHKLFKIGKAGRKRLKGIRPTVRGTAMYPKAHPHGGGEGRSPVGMKHPKTPWGKNAYGVKTRNKKKYSNKMIIKRRK
ncbi:MAG: 50S ribosomal protein L2 [Patescibacteria group bacterium]|nr:50S ribosomal protein L2 [Patescibacteria group bacterium]